MTAHKPRELPGLVRERRAVVAFLTTLDPTKSQRSYMGPKPTEAMRQLLPLRDRGTTLRTVRSTLDRILAKSGPRIGPDMGDSPLLCAWAAIGRVTLPRPGDPEATVLLKVASDEICRARGQERYVSDAYLLELLGTELGALER
jgi:hypothetical protein